VIFIRRVWIDTLCINQVDVNERSQSVSFMKEINDLAENVVVWLGGDDSSAKTAIPIIRKAARIVQEQFDFAKEDVHCYHRAAETGDGLPDLENANW
jgi:hypothetical protein